MYKILTGINEGYAITNYGRVLSFIKQGSKVCYGYDKIYSILSPRESPNGYLRVYIRDSDNIRKDFYIHRLVALYFIENPDNKPLVNHKDHNRCNNHVNNLEWVTYKENNVDTLKVGNTIRGLDGRFKSNL